jgi:putative nucleotidyltransferase with HDIG domain
MSSRQMPSRIGQVYLSAVPWVGTGVLIWALADLYLSPPDPSWLALAALTVLTGAFTVKIPELVARLSVSEPFVFAATLWFGPSVGAVTAALDALIMSLWLLPGLKTLHRLAFNVSVLVISIWLASQLFFAISDIDLRAPVYTSLTHLMGPLYVFTLCCFLLNSGMVAAALAIERGQSVVRIWREQFLWLSLNYFGGASVAALLVVYARSIDWPVIGLIVPLLAISYLTFRTTLGRLEDANRHLGQLNDLHLSTIETLAMAVDAKDQVTHGHIRRVQRYALGLCSSLGIADEKLLRAVEAAALLHDMGKLAIPEYILNKPGKLSPAEFEKMKLHASLGADILCAISFSYPVIPIVRHHHENWDGTGYPSRLRGTDIPLGARILSVVDCYDALTSDRPYRPRLPNDEAIAIIMQRRGKMYDPLVVDTFVETLPELERSSEDLEPVSPILQQIAELSVFQPLSHLMDSGTQLEETVNYPAHALAPVDVAPMVLGLTAGSDLVSGCAYYMVAEGTTELVVVSVAGQVSTAYLGSRTEIGDRVVGWAAATNCSVTDASAVLEVGDQLEDICPGAKTCSVFPIGSPSGVLGVLAVFSPKANGLSQSDEGRLRRVATTVGSLVGSAAVRAADDEPLGSDILRAACFPIGVVAIKTTGNASSVGAAIKTMVRASDNFVSLENGTFVLLMQRVSSESVQGIVERLTTYANDAGHRVECEWAVLHELSERVDRKVAAALGAFVGQSLPRPQAKLH